MRTPWIVVAMSLTLGACGGGDSPSSPSTASTQPTTLNFSPTVAGYGYAIQDVTAFQSAGQVTATLRWNDSRKDLDLYWTNALCVIEGSGFGGTGCQNIAQSLASTGTSETVTGPLAAGSIVRLFIINYDAAPEATTVVVNLRP